MDKVADFLVAIKNAGRAKKDKVDLPASNLKVSIAEILASNGFIKSFRVARDSNISLMRIYLKYDARGNHAISEIERVSTPGRRVYVKPRDIPNVRSGLGIAILSTNLGILSGRDATQRNVGGEFICKVW
jgi:small subunit ribosomal protein S8